MVSMGRKEDEVARVEESGAGVQTTRVPYDRRLGHGRRHALLSSFPSSRIHRLLYDNPPPLRLPPPPRPAPALPLLRPLLPLLLPGPGRATLATVVARGRNKKAFGGLPEHEVEVAVEGPQLPREGPAHSVGVENGEVGVGVDM